MAAKIFLLSLTLIVGTLLVSTNGAHLKDLLKYGYYDNNCPGLEDLILEEMKSIQAQDASLMPALLRLHFHDCFVHGCDASVLLISKNGTAEKDAGPNLSLRGFEAIERIKTKLEMACPQLVSCADILAIAARDAVYLSGGTRYNVETGRKDGNISSDKAALANLPPGYGNITTLINLYATKNLSIVDLVVLSGAHTFGASHCASFSDRLYNYSGAGDTDPNLDGAYADYLKQKCAPGDSSTIVEMDPGNPLNFNLDYFKVVWDNKGLFTADAALLNNNVTNAYVLKMFNAVSPDKFYDDFAESMIHMGRIDVLTGTNGTIRGVCGSYVD
ncbi:hypothetical protein LUZ60_005532 [Juncus effusus]|nr:hypothetical protein LUZ60_005532 [Juncus effusus]